MRKPYSTDLSDVEWNYIEPHLPAPKEHGLPRIHSSREILDAIFLLLRPKKWLPVVASTSPRFSSMAHRLLLLQKMAHRWHLGKDQPGYPRTSARSLAEEPSAQRWHRR